MDQRAHIDQLIMEVRRALSAPMLSEAEIETGLKSLRDLVTGLEKVDDDLLNEIVRRAANRLLLEKGVSCI